MNQDDLLAVASRSTWDRRRAEAMGWLFDRIELGRHFETNQLLLRADFRCVCGAAESFAMLIDPHLPRYVLLDVLDVAKQLRVRGSFSRDHLLADGYTEAQVREFERKGEEFDRSQ